MGQTARKTQPPARTSRRAPHLRLVDEPVKRAARAGRPPSARASERRARTVFQVFAVLLVVTCVLGGARVALIVRATEIAMSENRLQADIKQQRVEVDQLEVDRSSLSTPSRIGSIATTTMRMAPPRSVNYVDVRGAEATASAGSAAAQDAAAAGQSPTGLGALVAAVMDMSAGEAQSLLVGELGLAGSR
jgi:cell division protein FtsL